MPGLSLESGMAGGETHAYTFSLQKGRFADLVVDQRGIDVVVKLCGPGDRLLTTVDSPNGAQGPEPVPVVADAGGSYRLEIRASAPPAPAGRYAVLVRAVRPADGRDRGHTAAERTLAEGEALWQSADAASRRRAVAKYREAIAGFRALDERDRQAEALSILGDYLKDLAEPAPALAAYQEAIVLFRELSRRCETADALNRLGLTQITLGNTEEALRSYREALAIDRALRDRRAEASTLYSIARAYTLQGKMEKALDTYEKELALQQEPGQEGNRGFTLVSLGRAYFQMGEPQRAIDYFNRGLPLLQAGGRPEAAGALDDLGKALVWTGRTREGIAMLQRSRREQRQAGNRTGEATALNDLGAADESLGRKAEARRFYEEAVPLLRQTGDRVRESMALLNLGRLQEEAGELRSAAESYSRVLRVSEASGNRSYQAAAWLGLAHVHRRSGDLTGARQAAESALALVEALRLEMVSPELRTSFFATKQEYYEFYVGLLMQLHGREPAAGHDRRAFEASELARARSLLDTLAQARADLRREIDPRLLAQEAALGDRVNAAERRRLSLAESGAPGPRVE
ncbi:MAG TPA: tetratricopeptide repeat protein, partial [Thermoanaerobaculia bacterium]|nr:tetratricopeptide repeat protein [Thermoanaerobaculia bacterium]